MYTIVVICCLRCFFVFKQKTAYEMRISDWSSDVCSSDLAIARSQNRLVENGPSGASTSSRGDNIWMPVKTNGATRLRPRRPVIRPSADRKSVVEGKSVSVRVDLGGRSSLKNKTKR